MCASSVLGWGQRWAVAATVLLLSSSHCPDLLSSPTQAQVCKFLELGEKQEGYSILGLALPTGAEWPQRTLSTPWTARAGLEKCSRLPRIPPQTVFHGLCHTWEILPLKVQVFGVGKTHTHTHTHTGLCNFIHPCW